MSFPYFLYNDNSAFLKVFVAPKIITFDFKCCMPGQFIKVFYLPVRLTKMQFKNLSVYSVDSMTMLNLAPLESTVPVKCLLHNSGQLFLPIDQGRIMT